MKDKTLKLQRVQKTIEICKNMAADNKKFEEQWTKLDSHNAFTCRQLAEAYEFIARLLERDLEDNDENIGLEN